MPKVLNGFQLALAARLDVFAHCVIPMVAVRLLQPGQMDAMRPQVKPQPGAKPTKQKHVPTPPGESAGKLSDNDFRTPAREEERERPRGLQAMRCVAYKNSTGAAALFINCPRPHLFNLGCEVY